MLAVHPLGHRRGDAHGAIAALVHGLGMSEFEHSGDVEEHAAHGVARCVPLFCELVGGEVLLQGGCGRGRDDRGWRGRGRQGRGR